MDKSNEGKFKEVITTIADNYSKTFTESEIKLWWTIFKPYLVEQFEQAVFQHIADPDSGMFAPKPANIIRFLKPTEKQLERLSNDRAEIAWIEVEKKISSVGAYGSLKMEDKQALAAVESLGSWRDLCHTPVDKLQWKRKQFIDAYNNFERSDVNMLPERISGLVAIEKRKRERKQGIENIAAIKERIGAFNGSR